MGILRTALALVAATAATAHAGGQYVGANGSQALQRAGAFAAKADDPTALEHNPAGLARVRTPTMFAGLHVVDMSAAFARTGRYEPDPLDFDGQPAYTGDAFPEVDHAGPAQPIPMLVAAFPIGDDVTLAAGLIAPHSYVGRDYPEAVSTTDGATAPAPQRYDIVYLTGLVAGANAGAAVRVGPRVTLGARVGVAYGRVVLRKYAHGLPNDTEQPGLDARVTIDATDRAIPIWGAGIHVAATRHIEIGAAYASAVHIDATGIARTRLGDTLSNPLPGVELSPPQPVADASARCAPGGTADALSACVDATLPQTATAGIRAVWRDGAGGERADVELDVRWEDWSAASNMTAVIDGVDPLLGQRLPDQAIALPLRDVWSVRAGGSAAISRHVTVRGGVAYDTASADVSWTNLVVDTAPRITAAAGVGVTVGRARIDAGVAVAQARPRLVRDVAIADPTDPAQREQPDVAVALPIDPTPHHPYNAGGYATSYAIGSIGLAICF